MYRAFCRGFAGLAIAISGVSISFAGMLSNGPLTVETNDSTGTVHDITFNGTHFFEYNPIADFGFQGKNNPTLELNQSNAATDYFDLSMSGLSYSGTYDNVLDIAFTRTYSLVPGQNVLRVETSFTNNSADAADFSYFDIYDPDPGATSAADDVATINDRFILDSVEVGQASLASGLSVLIGSYDSRAVVGSGNPTGNWTSFFSSGNPDADGALSAANRLQIGLQTTLASGAMTSFTYDLAFGTSVSGTQNEFIEANVATVPEPTSLALYGLGTLCCGIGAAYKRRMKKNKDS